MDDAPLHEPAQMTTTDHVGADRAHKAEPQPAPGVFRQHAKAANDHNVQSVPWVVQNGFFPPTEQHPLRVDFFGDEVTEIRPFSVADQRSQPEVEASEVRIHPCRELLLTEKVRARAADLAAADPGDTTMTEMLGKLAEGIPVEGMEALIPALVDGDMQLLTEVIPDGTRVLILDPEKVRTRPNRDRRVSRPKAMALRDAK